MPDKTTAAGELPELPKQRCGPETGHAVVWVAEDLIAWREASVTAALAQKDGEIGQLKDLLRIAQWYMKRNGASDARIDAALGSQA